MLKPRLASAALLLAVSLQAQQYHPVTGRRIAGVMGVAGADWLERSEREQEENPGKAIAALGIREGMVIADIGAGTGYYSFRIAALTGPSGKVYASDIQPGMIALLEKRMKREGVRNIETVLGTASDPKLPRASIDLALLVDVYHEFSEPQKMLAAIATALKPDGRLVLLEFRKEDPNIPIRIEHKMSVDEVKRELTAEGFAFDKLLDPLPWQHILIFKKDGAR
jgi:SAM-dependent methyltransferase